MPEPITRRQLRVLNGENNYPILLIEIRLAGATLDSTIRFTNAPQVLTFGGYTWSPVQFARAERTRQLSTDSNDSPSTTITFQNVDSQFAAMLNQVELTGAICKLYGHDLRALLQQPDRMRDAIVLESGEIRTPVLTENLFTCEIVSIFGLMDQFSLPRRMFQPKCNYVFGSTACGAPHANVAPNRITSTLISGSTRDFVRVAQSVFDQAGNPEDPSAFWENGYVVMMNGLAACQSRPIRQVIHGGSKRGFELRYPFQGFPAAGDEFLLLRGCPGTKAACFDRQGNVLNFGGFEEVPFQDIKVVKPLKGYGD